MTTESEIEKILNDYANQGFATYWCKGCKCYAVLCPECGSNQCGGGLRDCGTCEVAWNKQTELWDKTQYRGGDCC